MYSPTSLTIENVIIPSGDTQDYPISRIFGQLIEPKRGWVFPNFMEYQDPGVIDTAGDQEGASMEEVGTGVEAGATHQSLPQLQSPVSITTVSNISDMLCTHNCPAEYCHDHQCYPVFIPPPESRCIACNILQHAQEAHEAGIGPIVGYTISGDDSNNKNGPNATAVPPQPQGQGMGSWGRCWGRRGGGQQDLWEMQKKEGPIRLYHPWQTHLVGVQAGRSMSPIPRFFKLNQGPGYIPFLITNDQGQNVPAKYVSVHMTANP